MRILRVHLYQEYACYRTPWSFENVETFPLPPYSSVLGLLHAALGEKDTLRGIRLSVQGEYGGLIRNYVRYRKYKKGEVTPYPVLVSELHDVRVIIHVSADEDLLGRLKEAFLDPPRYLHLGRYEDIVRVEDVEMTEATCKCVEDLKNDAYIPEALAVRYDVSENGVLYALPFYYRKRNGRRVFQSVKTYYLQKGTDLEDKALADRDGYPVFLTGGAECE